MTSEGLSPETQAKLDEFWETVKNNKSVKELFEKVRQERQVKIAGLLKEAENGDPDAQYEVAVLYDPEDCPGSPSDEIEAVKWYRKAAENNHYFACCSLGRLYEYGDYGLEKDWEMAAMWYRKAMTVPNADGNYTARMNLTYLLEAMEE